MTLKSVNAAQPSADVSGRHNQWRPLDADRGCVTHGGNVVLTEAWSGFADRGIVIIVFRPAAPSTAAGVRLPSRVEPLANLPGDRSFRAAWLWAAGGLLRVVGELFRLVARDN